MDSVQYDPEKEQRLRQYLAKGLGPNPVPGSCDVALPKRVYPRLSLGIGTAIASTLIIALLLASLFTPLLTRAFCQLPLLGPSYERMLTRSGLHVAYTTGLLPELGLSYQLGDWQIDIMHAYSDAYSTFVIYKISSEEHCVLSVQRENLFVERMYTRWNQDVPGVYTQYISSEDENTLYVITRHAPLRWWEGNMVRLRLEISGALTEARTPVQRYGNRYVETRKVGAELLDGSGKLLTATFTPIMTTLTYQLDEGYFPHMSIVDQHGNELPKSSAFEDGGRKGGRLVSQVFGPTASRQLTLIIDGLTLRHQIHVPMKLGWENPEPGPGLRVEGIEQIGSQWAATIRWNDEDSRYRFSHAIYSRNGIQGTAGAEWLSPELLKLSVPQLTARDGFGGPIIGPIIPRLEIYVDETLRHYEELIIGGP